jgi:hypothetical protein
MKENDCFKIAKHDFYKLYDMLCRGLTLYEMDNDQYAFYSAMCELQREFTDISFH